MRGRAARAETRGVARADARVNRTSRRRAPRAGTRARGFWDGLLSRGASTSTTDGDGRVDGASASGRSSARGGVAPVAPKAEESISALSALLGEAEGERARAAAEAAADARRAEARERERLAREAREGRRKAFVKADKATDRVQRLQAVFLDVPLGLLDFSTMRDKTPGGEDLGEEPRWFKLPMEVFDKVTGERFVVDEESESGMELRPKNADGEEEEEIARLPGEFQVPVIPYPFVATPGSYVKLNLFEPRWLTLFSKLIPPNEDAAVAPSAQTAVKTDEDEFRAATGRRVLRGLDGKSKIDLNALRLIDAYETGERTFDIVPGFGRLPEDAFVDTNAFGAVYRGLDGQIAGVGTLMDVQGHDVVVDGRLLSVCAKGTKRFKILRVAQTEPYIIVDAVPIDDDGAAPLSADAESADAVNDIFDLMKKVDPYYMEAIGLQDVSKSDLKGMNEFDLANVMFYSHPDLSLKLLTCADAEKRRRVVNAAAKSFKRAIELGFTPRKTRLLGSFVSLGIFFGLGFLILALKNALDGDPSGLDNF